MLDLATLIAIALTAPVAGQSQWVPPAACNASRSSDGSLDGRTMSLSGGLSCGLGRLLGGPTMLSFQGGYERHDDAVYRDSSARGVFGLVRLKVAAF